MSLKLSKYFSRNLLSRYFRKSSSNNVSHRNMTITFFFRSNKCGYSIRKVFEPIITEVSKECQVKVYEVPNHQANPVSILKNLWFVFRHRNRSGINHITGDLHYLSFVLPENRTITTVHDLCFWDSEFRNYSSVKKIFIKTLYLNSLQYNKYLICISEKTKISVLKHLNIEPEKVLVINNPISQNHTNYKKEFNKDCPVILHIGTRVNKNLETVIQALNDINCSLRIVGELSNEQIHLLETNNISYINLVGLTDEEILIEYIKADVISFPSLYEGFGMIIIEGQAIGRVVITTNLSPMKEVAAGSAFLVNNPLDVSELHNAFLKMINDDNLRNILINKGLKNIKRFSAKIVKEEYVKVYQNILNNYRD